MAAESVIPQSYPSLTTGQAPASINEMLATDLDQDELLRDLLNDNDLLSSLLSSDQPTGVPLTSSDLFTTGLSTNFDSTDLSLQQSLLNDPLSQHAFNDHSLQHTHANPSLQLSSPVGSEECVSDFSIEQSPSWSTNSSDGFLLPNMAAQPQLDQQQLGQIGGNLESDLQMSGITDQQRSTSSPSSSGGDVHIDLGDVSAMVGSSDRLGIVSSSSERKMGGSTITKEEEKMLAEEGIYLPADMPLTKAEEKHLKRVRRKIKNKISAAESRKRKKDYVEGLEERVEKCTKINRSLQERVINLKKHNRSLLTQLKRLQEYVSQCSPTKVRAGSCIMVLLLSFSLLMVHNLQLTTSQDNAGVILRSYSSRALLKVEADDFGNLVDPETRQVISAAGSKSPILPPPWKCQTPSFDFWNTRQKG